MIYLLAIIWFFGILYLDVESDFKKWKNNVPVKHTKEAIERGLMLLPTFGLLMVHTNWRVWDVLITMGLMGSVYWELFDGLYNTLRGFKWRFNGSVDEDDSILDKFLYKIGDKWEAVLKLGLIVLFLFLYFLTLNSR